MNARTLAIETLLDRIESWPETAQEEALGALLAMDAKFGGVYQLSAEERVAVQRGLAQVAAGQVVADEEVEAVLQRRRR